MQVGENSHERILPAQQARSALQRKMADWTPIQRVHWVVIALRSAANVAGNGTEYKIVEQLESWILADLDTRSASPEQSYGRLDWYEEEKEMTRLWESYRLEELKAYPPQTDRLAALYLDAQARFRPGYRHPLSEQRNEARFPEKWAEAVKAGLSMAETVDRLRRKCKNLGPTRRKLLEVETESARYKQELEHLKGILKTRRHRRDVVTYDELRSSVTDWPAFHGRVVSGVYLLKDVLGVRYIGCCSRLDVRMQHHVRRWRWLKTCEVIPFAVYDSLELSPKPLKRSKESQELEALLIYALRPPENETLYLEHDSSSVEMLRRRIFELLTVAQEAVL